jgi:helicase
MSVPDVHVDFAFAENCAASMSRQARGLSSTWEQLVSNAQAVIGVFANAPLARDGSHPVLYEESSALPLIAAARVLHAAATQFSSEALSPADRDQMRLLAALGYAMYGNAPSAHAAASQIETPPEQMTAAEALAAAIAVPRKMGYFLRGMPPNTPARSAADALGMFLNSGSDAHLAASRSTFVEVLKTVKLPFDALALRAARLAIQHVWTLSTARSLSPLVDSLPTGYLERLVEDHVITLLPPQYQLISEQSLLLPTSTGKTLVGELCLARALSTSPGLVCFVAPYVAIGRQVATSLRRHLPEQCRVHSMFGTFATDGSLLPEMLQEVVVATPERLDGLLRGNPALYDHLRCVVVDEAHLIENGGRGMRLEGLLTRLRLKQQQGCGFRMICLSAVLGGYDSLSQWLAIPPEAVFTHAWKPTARRLAFWSEAGTLTWVQGADPVRRAGATTFTNLGRREVPWPNQGLQASEHFAALRRDRPKAHQNVAYLAELSYRELGGTVLCVCTTKSATRSLARELAARFAEVQPLPAALATAVARIEAEHSHLGGLCAMLRRGVAFHNAGLPQPVRFLIEDAVKAGCMHAVAATTTLAEGVDLPFRTTILADWLVGFGDQQRPMSPLMFRNIAGRCGRAGVFTEGDTIIFDNPLGSERFTVGHRWYRIQNSLLAQPQELQSTLLQEQFATPLKELDAMVSSQFLAAIPENPNDDSLIESFVASSYAAHRTGGAARAADIVGRIGRFVLDPAHGPFATAASPMRLTALGEAANLSGFSPSSCRAILLILDRLDAPATEADLAASLLSTLADLPEQTNRSLKQVVEKPSSRFCVKPADFASVVAARLLGSSRAATFVALPFVLRSTRSVPISDWSQGRDNTDAWGADFDKFDEFMAQAIESFLPWVLRACGRLQAHSRQEWTHTFAWDDLAGRLEATPDTPDTEN